MTAKKETMFDISAIDTVEACNKPFELQIEHPVTGDKLPVFISIVGKDSDIYRSKIKALANKQIAGRNKQTETVDTLEAQNVNVLVAATVGWRGMAMDGEELAFTPENARKVYKRILPIRNQVQAAIDDLGNFMTG